MVRGKVFKRCDLAFNSAVWRALAGAVAGAIYCQRARKNFKAGNAFVSGDGRSSRWCTVEVSSQRLWCVSVMGVREKCDEKKGGHSPIQTNLLGRFPPVLGFLCPSLNCRWGTRTCRYSVLDGSRLESGASYFSDMVFGPLLTAIKTLRAF
jgi:hypothetical protein